MQNKILLCAVNARYIHSNLAVRYLKKYCGAQFEAIEIAEFSINDNMNNILKRLYNSGAGIYGFSCYIWNISQIRSLCSSLKKVRPEAVIILGGPEVSYDPASLLSDNPSVDYVVAGEGEETLLDLLDCITESGCGLSGIPGIAYRDGGKISVNQPRPLIPALDMLPFPYDSFDEFENKIIYYETSRGCPFNCQYCLSSTTHGVRYLSMDRLRQDIKRFADSGINQVKLVDRTFNCDISRSIDIMKYIIELNSATNFHFEIAADLINERFLEVVEKAPKGMFQFEIGVQSTNPETLSEIKRKMDFGKVSSNVRELIAFGNTHVHTDLIAGLPFEDIKSFEKSFNDVYALKADMLQLGFLKLLKGSGIRERLSLYGMEHHDFPPYEVLKTNWLSYKELLLLKDIEHVLEQYHNSGKFRHTLEFLLRTLPTAPFDFYRRMSDFWNLEKHFGSSKSVNELYMIFRQFVSDVYSDVLGPDQFSLLNEYMKLDWLLYCRSGSMPGSIMRFDHTHIKERLQEYLKNHLTNTEGFEAFKNMPMRELLKHVGYEVFTWNIFGDIPCECRVVMFFPFKQSTVSTKPLFSIVPLKEIL
ncbi:MAG TPA: B12-binding domain-containing radical SAM protein [Clostridia bacterium]|nr:B12-binding domain-containing radical SAM protein [Clostridia bacterium]